MDTQSRGYKDLWDALAPARRQFYERLYQWASADLEREVNENFRLARRVKGSLAQSTIAVAEDMSLDERRAAFRAEFKRGFGHALGRKLTSPEEDVRNEEFRVRWRAYKANPALSGYPQLTPKIPREGFRKLLRDKMAGHGFGDFGWWDKPAEWCYRLRVGDWFVVTHINTGGRSLQLEYGHVIESPLAGRCPSGGAKNIELSEGRINCLTMLGFSARWDRLTSEDLPEAADDLIVLCRHFLNAVPDLLRGLETTGV